MNLFGFSITRTKATTKAPGNLAGVDSRGNWLSIIREGFSGAWQSNVEISVTNVMTFSAVYSCVTLIASDIGKLRIKLMQQDAEGIWTETESPAFSPVLRKPNKFQTRIKFLEQWLCSKLIHGNTYVLKQRDQRGVVISLIVLDAQRCRPLVAVSGDVYYELKSDSLAGISMEGNGSVVVPASEIIHDVMCALYHPLVGISPITACGLAATQGLKIQNNSASFFSNGSNPGGLLTAPETISDETAARLKEYFDTNFTGSNVGKVAVLGDGLKFEKMTMSALDSQLIEQLKWTAENVCTAFHVPSFMIGVGPMPTYANIEALNTQYYSQALQNPIESIELLLDEGLGLTENGQRYGTELDLTGLLRMDSTTRTSAAEKSMKSGMTPNEVRRIYYDLGSVPGGDAVYAQQQNFSLEALSKRDARPDPFATTPALPPAAEPAPAPAP